MSTKYPDDGYTDSELVEVLEAAREIPRGLGILEDYTRYEKKEGGIEAETVNIHMEEGGKTKPFYVNVSSQNDEVKTTSDNIRQWAAFKGRWQTFLNGNDLMVPVAYHELLQRGGVITTGPGVHLMVFGKKHWERMELLISRELGVDSRKIDVMRHIYMHHLEFDGLTYDEKGNASITLNDELIKYADLRSGVDSNGKGFVILVGLMYYAEVYDKKHYDDIQLAPGEIRELAAQLS